LALAELLDFERPRNIRQLIERNKDELSRHGEVCCITQQTSSEGGRPGTEYWLTEWQAIIVCMKSEAPRAEDARDAEQAHVQRKRQSHRKSNAKRPRVSGAAPSSAAPESPAPVISLAVRRIQGMIRSLSMAPIRSPSSCPPTSRAGT
jgi:hypothetical protein